MSRNYSKRNKAELNKMNEFDRLVTNLKDGNLSLTHIDIAYRSYIKDRNDIPEGVKDLLCGSKTLTGILENKIRGLNQITGIVELAYRRGASKIQTKKS